MTETSRMEGGGRGEGGRERGREREREGEPERSTLTISLESLAVDMSGDDIKIAKITTRMQIASAHTKLSRRGVVKSAEAPASICASWLLIGASISCTEVAITRQ